MMIDLAGADWINAPATRAVMDALNGAREDSARFVGGCLRNALRGVRVDDIDIATQLPPKMVADTLERAGIRAIPTGIEHGTITAVCHKQPFEITTLRRDIETDGRRAIVAFTEDWAEDAARRDFRMNAIYASADGQLHEIIPQSVSDAIDGHVIFIGDADARLREDYLRILRFFRFNAWYGSEIDREGLLACERQQAGLDKIAAERIWKELSKLFTAPDPANAVLAMSECGVLSRLLPNNNGGQLHALVEIERRTAREPDNLQRLMALLPRRTREAEQIASKLKMSNAQRTRLQNWAAAALVPVLGRPDAEIHAAIYKHGAEAVRDRAIIEASETGAASELEHLLSILETWHPPRFPLGGNDALALGLRGADIGQALAHVEADWIDSDFTISHERLSALLKRQIINLQVPKTDSDTA